jgi:hypothetical protein
MLEAQAAEGKKKSMILLAHLYQRTLNLILKFTCSIGSENLAFDR